MTSNLVSASNAVLSGLRGRVLCGCLAVVFAGACTGRRSDGAAATPAAATPDGHRVVLAGNTHPLATPENSLGPVADDFRLDHLQLVLKRSPEKEAELTARIDAMHTRGNPQYQKWMTAEQFGAEYGVPQAEVDKVTGWLKQHGFRIDGVPTSRMFIEFSGTAAQVREAFHTEIHQLKTDRGPHFANMSDPEIPEALAGTVVGVHALHDFKPVPLHRVLGKGKRHAGKWSVSDAAPEFTTAISGDTYQGVAPADFATIYNLNPLFAAGITGSGQTIAVIEDTLIQNASDVTSFRAAFGLSAYHGTFSQGTVAGTTTCTNPGVNGSEGEAALDVEWAGAAAPDATVRLVACADTTTVFGGLIALQNLLNGTNPPPIISNSYGLCESSNGAAANQSYVNTYQQAAALGISVYVAAGDQGAAVCDASKATATHGIAVSGFASTPYNVAVGGTDFMDTYNSLTGGVAVSTYWSATNSGSYGSALSYIPEMPWNDSCANKPLYTLEGSMQAYYVSASNVGFCNTTTGKNFRTTEAGSGGPSAYSKQPFWQTGVVGLPTKSGATNPRYLPDVSLFSGNGLWNHFYVFCLTDTAQGGAPCDYANSTDVGALVAGGTSFAAPAFAGIQALINQKMGAPQGNPNYTFYKLAAAQYGARGSTRCNGSSATLPKPECIFNDVTQGDIDVDCSNATPNCYGANGTVNRGILSTSTTAPAPAYAAGTGWDSATGLGTVNAYNLVMAWSQ